MIVSTSLVSAGWWRSHTTSRFRYRSLARYHCASKTESFSYPEGYDKFSQSDGLEWESSGGKIVYEIAHFGPKNRRSTERLFT